MEGPAANHLIVALALAFGAGLAMPLGAWLAMGDALHHRLTRSMRHGIVAFGGGALVAAVALVLVPRGAEALSAGAALAFFCAGGLCFFGIDRALERGGGAGAQLLAMLLDYLPEAAALGAMLVIDRAAAALLALLIFLQNVPEGFAAFREIEQARRPRPGHLIALFLALAVMGPGVAALGLFYLVDRPATLGAIMLFAAGGILYLVFQDIAPAAQMRDDWAPPLGAVAGFALGLAGHLLVQ